ncbi:MAG: 16S rRNA (adenine(1518)-N(6)/adenine(1519)-N(6))-dimethyltransferase RsmA [Planctomycetales bacterium]|nr:16S rRNA (adenine(1518)-N(6)/adenine(1519)-N(6))-dimethyltransferase RsmA [Planctomycetales bacterium]
MGLSDTLRARGLRPRKPLGQHFLSDPRILDSIADAAGLGPGEVALEIGPGTGLLTRRLAGRAGRVVAVELDRALAEGCRIALGDLGDRVEVVAADALDGRGRFSRPLRAALDRARGPGPRPWRLVANLPYGAASQAIVAALEHPEPPEAVVVTIQREMADRLRAAPGSAAYGALTVRVALLADVEVLRHLAPGAFWPPPKVRSSVVRLRPRPGAREAVASAPLMDRVLRALFDYRRKRADRALEVAGLATRAAAAAALAAAGAPAGARGERLQPETILALARALPPPTVNARPPPPSHFLDTPRPRP